MPCPKLLLSCLLLQLMFFFLVPEVAQGHGLKVGFYQKACPNAEAIVKEVIGQVLSIDPSLSGPILRLHFHDCFVRGCEGSVLLESPTYQSEKYAIRKLGLRGYQEIDRVKTALEKACPGIVSCADILALVTRDIVVATGGLFYDVETGRRDGYVSILEEALRDLIPPSTNITTLKADFAKRGLSAKDLVVLSGGHTIGNSHCAAFSNRLYNFTGKGDADPTLDSNYIARLKLSCKPNDQTTLVEMDPGSARTFDIKYFDLILKRRGLFTSDAALLDDKQTKAYLDFQIKTGGSTFFKDFGVSMVKMGRIGVLTKTAGEVRKVCTKVN
ncbi:peroxidase 27-like [Eucalyptus grandis]|uniref:peroxidase 27-like n=1 Tax=Eucalyptus grandis TaxID=71139 RepID=UPI00192EFD95|nr:peroxidase 27-like [Eucalyptus grandis]